MTLPIGKHLLAIDAILSASVDRNWAGGPEGIKVLCRDGKTVKCPLYPAEIGPTLRVIASASGYFALVSNHVYNCRFIQSASLHTNWASVYDGIHVIYSTSSGKALKQFYPYETWSGEPLFALRKLATVRAQLFSLSHTRRGNL